MVCSKVDVIEHVVHDTSALDEEELTFSPIREPEPLTLEELKASYSSWMFDQFNEVDSNAQWALLVDQLAVVLSKYPAAKPDTGERS